MTSVYFENGGDSSSEDGQDEAMSDLSPPKYGNKNSPPAKLKYLWKCLTYPIRMYRRFEWWCIEHFLATKIIQRERVTLRLHHKYRENHQLALLYYFHDLAQEHGESTKSLSLKPDMGHIEKLISEGADVHACDDIGQNLMHEIARYHGAEVCFFFLDYSVNINLEDDYSCTPLHVSAAYNNSAIVEILASNGGELEATTFYMLQTPLHYAARYDSPSSVMKLVEMGAAVEARDYRGRTPLLLAAELGRVSAGAMLLECGAKVYAIDFTGMYALSAMVNKCPPLALKGLDACVKEDLRNRKLYFSLQFLEPRTLCNDECAKVTFTVLEEAVRANNLDIIRHRSVQAIIDVKWKQFGRRGYIKELSAYIMVLFNWSVLCYLNPILGKTAMAKKTTNEALEVFYRTDLPIVDYFPLVNEILTAFFFFYQVFDEVRELRTNVRRHKKFVNQRLKQLEMEFKYLELLSTEEKEYLRKEQEVVRKSYSSYTKDLWNAFDWISIVLMFVTLNAHLAIKYSAPRHEVSAGMLLSITVIIVWIKLFKYVRVLKTLGPFCVIIASLPKDFVKIIVVYMILYVPMVCVFYHFYTASGEYDATLTEGDDAIDVQKYGTIPQTCFTVFLFTLVDDYGYETLMSITEQRKIGNSWTHGLIAFWIIISSVILLNIFIALMSDTFARVYENALVVAQYERAAMIVSIENKLPSYWRKHYLIDIGNNHAPTCVFFDDDEVPDSDDETLEQSIIQADKTLKKVTSKIKQKNNEDFMEYVTEKIKAQNQLVTQILEKIEKIQSSPAK